MGEGSQIDKNDASFDEDWREWVRSLVHDLRNPVGVAMGNLAYLAKVVPEGDDEARLAMDEAQYELQRVSSMLQDLLDIDSLQRKRLAVRPVPVDLGGVARAAVKSARVLCEAKSIGVTVEDEGDGGVEGDMVMLTRVFANVVGNSVRYARKEPVRVTIHGKDAHVVEARVRNDGPGISPEVLERLFEPWQRLRTRSVTQSVGLGLAFCRLALEAHGGRVWVESADDGNVVFAIQVPRKRKA